MAPASSAASAPPARGRPPDGLRTRRVPYPTGPGPLTQQRKIRVEATAAPAYTAVMSTQNNQFHTDYQRVAAALEFLANHHREQPSLEEIAAQVHLSPTHFQKLFKRWAGVSPNQFRQFLTIEYAKRELRNASSVLDTALAAGLSGPGRLHDLFVTWEAITPGEYRKAGATSPLQPRQNGHRASRRNGMAAMVDALS